MLKLEKLSRSKDVSISLRPNQRFFNKTFLKALGLALAFHLLAALLFQVRPFKVTGSQTVFPPVLVDSDISFGSDLPVIADIDLEEALPRLVKEPKGTLLKFPPLSKRITAYRSEKSQYILEPSERIFAVLEKNLNSLAGDFWNQIMKKDTQLQIKPTGYLATRDLQGDYLASFSSKKPFKIVFMVQVDDQTGTIFWYDIKYKEGDEEMLLASENLLSQLKFPIIKDSFVSSGEIEMYYNGKSK